MLNKFGIALFAVLLVSFVVAPCGAAELVQNGGFENPGPGSFAGWTVTPASSLSLIRVDAVHPHTGTYAAAFGAQGTQDDSISQTLATVPGQSYNFSWWLAHPSDTTPNDFTVFWNGVPVSGTNGAPNFDYTQFSTPQTAGPLPTVISFSGREVPAWFYLDDVSVIGPQAVPEPMSLLLFGFGLMGMAVINRKNKKEEI